MQTQKANHAGRNRTVVLGVIATAALTLVPALAVIAQDSRPTANVRAYGAVGDGLVNDTAAIQRANDAVKASGGVVYFPQGTYKAAGVFQDSNVEFSSNEGAVLKHPDGRTNLHIVNGRTFSKVGSIVEGSSVLQMSNTTGIVPGANLAVRGAGGASTVQTTTLVLGVSADSKSLSINHKNGWKPYTTYLLIDDEVLSYSSISGGNMKSLKRGLLGTKAAGHKAGAKVSIATMLYARVAEVGPNLIQLDRKAVQGVKSAEVIAGSINMSVRGLTLDGSRVIGGATNNPLPLNYGLARWVTIEGNTIRNGDHGAISLNKGTSDSTIRGNTMVDNGSPWTLYGSTVWLFQGASDNTVTQNVIGGVSFHGIYPDDRTELASEWDAPSDRNVITNNKIDIVRATKNVGIYVVGTRGTVVDGNAISSMLHGVFVGASTQGPVPATTSGSHVRNNSLTGLDVGLYVTGNGNSFERNQLSLNRTHIVDQGSENSFIENLLS